MQSKALFLLGSVAAAATLPFTSGPEPEIATCPGRPASAEEQRAIFEQFNYQFFIAKNLTRAYSYVADDFLQHNKDIKNGRQATIDALAPVWSNSSTTILHSAFDSNFGWVHHSFIVPGQAPNTVIDIYRFEGSCIVEHWDSIEALPANPVSPNPLW